MGINVKAERVPIDSIAPHPRNPRHGNVDAIAESLRVNGQYSPIVVWNDTIIAGTHTWRAAKSLGWREIAVTRYEGTERDALRVLIADNRTSDVASYHSEHLIDMLRSLPDLVGTGYDKEALDELEGLYADHGAGVSKPLADGGDEPEGDKNTPVQFGPWRGELDPELHGIWLASVREVVGDKKPRVNREIRARLDVPKAARPRREREPSTPRHAVAESFTAGETETVKLSELQRFPGNPREGDVGAISESLRTLGQYRPVVVNRRNNQILKGNHTAAAAAALGWDEVAVVWVDVEDEAATRIVLADNRTADLATYDNDLLLEILGEVRTLEGTGFDADDLGDLERGGDATVSKSPKVRFKIGEHGFSVSQEIWDEWSAGLEIPQEPLRRLGIPVTAVVEEGR